MTRAGPFEAEPLGAGLVTSVSLGATVGAQRFKLPRAPMGVSYSVNSPFTATVEIGGCSALDPKARLAHVMLEGLGTGQLDFRASNLSSPGQLAFELREVATCTIENTFDFDVVSDAAVPVFAGSSVTLGAQCRDGEGNTLRGDSPLELTSDQTESRARIAPDGKLFVGSAPSRLQITPTVGSGGQQLEVVGAEAVSTLSATLSADTARPGETLSVKVSAFDQASRKIRGTGNVALTAGFAGEPGAWLVDLSLTNRHTIAVRPVSSQPTTLTITLGEAQTQVVLPQVLSP